MACLTKKILAISYLRHFALQIEIKQNISCSCNAVDAAIRIYDPWVLCATTARGATEQMLPQLNSCSELVMDPWIGRSITISKFQADMIL